MSSAGAFDEVAIIRGQFSRQATAFVLHAAADVLVDAAFDDDPAGTISRYLAAKLPAIKDADQLDVITRVIAGQLLDQQDQLSDETSLRLQEAMDVNQNS